MTPRTPRSERPANTEHETERAVYTAADLGKPIPIVDAHGRPVFVAWIKMRRTVPVGSSFTTALVLVEE